MIIAEQRAEQVIIPDEEVETPELIPEEKENQDIVFEEAETPEMRTKKDNLRKEMVRSSLLLEIFFLGNALGFSSQFRNIIDPFVVS